MYVNKFWMVPLSRTGDITVIYARYNTANEGIKFTLCNKESPFRLLFSSSLNTFLAFRRFRRLDFDL